MVECIRGLDDIAKYRRFRLLRPLKSVHQDAKAWWLYAAHCNGFRYTDTARQSEIAKDNLKYIEIYTKLAINPNETLAQELKNHKDKVEKERSYEELEVLREVS